MKTKNNSQIGAQIALLIGLPIGAIFSLAILLISLVPMFDLGLVIVGGRFFWHPLVWAGLIPATFIFSLWSAGKKIETRLDKNYSLIKTSFLFTLFVNTPLFAIILMTFLAGGIIPISQIDSPTISFAAIGLTVFTYLISVPFTTLTIGLLIVTITKNKIRERKLNCISPN